MEFEETASELSSNDRGCVTFTFTKNQIGKRIICRDIYSADTKAMEVIADFQIHNKNKLLFSRISGSSETFLGITAIKLTF